MKKISGLFIFVVSLLFFACSNIQGSDYSENPASSSTVLVSGQISKNPSGAVPKSLLDNLNANPDSSRTALPVVDLSSVYFVVTAEDKADSSNTSKGVVKTSDLTYQIYLRKNCTYTLSFSAYNSFNSSTEVYSGKIASSEVDVSVDEEGVVSGNLDVILRPYSAAGETGTVKLPISITADSGITVGEAYWSAGGTNYSTEIWVDCNDEDLLSTDFDMTATGFGPNIPAGAYTVTFAFWKEWAKAYTFTEIINVFSNQETNAWVKSTNCSYFKQSGDSTVVHLTAEDVNTPVEYYVDSVSGLDSNFGGFFDPVASVQSAVDKISSINDGVTEYKIILLSDYEAASDAGNEDPLSTDSNISKSVVVINPANTLNLKITSAENQKFAIDAKGGEGKERRVMYVHDNVNLTLENVIIKGGYTKRNGTGIYTSGNLTLNNTLVTENTEAPGGRAYGGGISCNTGTLTLNTGTEISYNHGATNGGGGIYAGTSALLIANPGVEIHHNESAAGGGIKTSTQKNSKLTGVKIYNNNSGSANGAGLWLGGQSSANPIEVVDCEIHDNQTTGSGGGIYSIGYVVLSGETKIYGNQAKYGGGISIFQNEFTIAKSSSVQIYENTATIYGGGVVCNAYHEAASFNFKGGLIKDNTAPEGNGIYVTDNSGKTYLAKFKLSGTAQLSESQLIHLNFTADSEQPQKFITLNSLTGDASAQKYNLKLGIYTPGETILAPLFGDTDVSQYVSRFTILDSLGNPSDYYLDAEGKLRTDVIPSVDMNSLYDPANPSTVATVPESGSRVTMSSPADLTYLSALVAAGNTLEGVIFELSESISTSGTWTPVGSSSKPFSGTFDGKGFSIENVNISARTYSGVFGNVSSAHIKNLKVTGTISSAGNYSGGIAGQVSGNTIIENCQNEIGISSTNNYIGGIVGYVSSGSNLIIRNCVNNSGVSGKSNVGGIVGNAAGTVSSLVIENCANLGGIQATGDSANVGGIIGYSQSSNTTIQNCVGNEGISAGASSMKGSVYGSVSVENTGVISNNYWLSSADPGFTNGPASASNMSKYAIMGDDIVISDPVDVNGYSFEAGSLLLDVLNKWTETSGASVGTYKTWKLQYNKPTLDF